MDWRTFQNRYSLAAKRNVQALKESLPVTGGGRRTSRPVAIGRPIHGDRSLP